jgi:hypothetical protein
MINISSLHFSDLPDEIMGIWNFLCYRHEQQHCLCLLPMVVCALPTTKQAKESWHPGVKD